MLRALSIRNFVIVDRLDLEFEAGFTVMTGETGAGKSILIDALALALGARAEAGVVRLGAERAEVVAEFLIPEGNPARAWLADQELQADEACVLRRVIDPAGKSRAFINGSSVSAQQLKLLSEWLLDIHGQHAHQSLQKSATQRALLDGFAGTEGLARSVGEAFRVWQQARLRWETWQSEARVLSEERVELQERVHELNALNLHPETWSALQTDHTRLAHVASLQEGIQFALEVLSEAEDAVSDRLDAVSRRLAELSGFDATLQSGLELVESAQIQLGEAVHELRRYAMGLEPDEAGLHQLEARMQLILGAARRHHLKPEQLSGYLQEISARLASLEAQGNGEALEQAVQDAETSFHRLARSLSTRRVAAAGVLGSTVTETMGHLAMGKGRFEILLAPLEVASASGLEEVEFRVSTHPTQPPGPLSRVASGGELSRISLAIQAALTTVSSVPTLIFDEVDTGIGGRVAEIVGRLLEGLGERHQVICVTHLPQVAARGRHHFSVTKTEQEGGVNSTIRGLGPEERVEELARMLGGVEITSTTRQHAAEMLSQ